MGLLGGQADGFGGEEAMDEGDGEIELLDVKTLAAQKAREDRNGGVGGVVLTQKSLSSKNNTAYIFSRKNFSPFSRTVKCKETRTGT